MSLVDRIYNNIESLFGWVSLGIKQNIRSYCDLETVDDEHTLVSKSGELISVIKLDGYSRLVGSEEFEYLSRRLTELLQPAFSSPGHNLQFFFSYDFDNIDRSVDKALTSSRDTAKRLQLDVEDILSSRIKTLASICADEEAYIVLWTGQSAVNKTHLKQIMKRHYAGLKNAKLPKMTFMQKLFLVLPEIRNLHQSFVSTIVEDLQQIGFYSQLLNGHDALYFVRKSVDPNFTDELWRPHLPGDKLPQRVQPDGSASLADIMWPPLDGQIFPRGGENLDLHTARIGDTIYAPLYIELFPKDIRPFFDLFRRMLPAKMPWRMSFFVMPDGLKITQSKSILARFLAFSSHYNRLLLESHRLLKNIHERTDNPVVTLTVTLATWAPADQPNLLKERYAKLAKVAQGWGGCEVNRVSGDPMGTTLSSALSVTKHMMATASAAPLSEAVHMLPFVRPASPWVEGAMVFRTPDGKIWPYQPGSSQQVSWIDLIYARSGSGKSVLINAINLGLCLSPGLTKLPRVSIIDIGPSSKGFVSLLQGALPPKEQHQVLYHRLRLVDQDAINVFDTQLGARFPTKLHRAFLVNFLSLLLVDNIEDSPPEGISSMLNMIIDETYRRFSDLEQPKVYVAHLEKTVHQKLIGLKFKIIPKTTWWNVADFLFEKGERVLALKAELHASPTIADTIAVAHFQSIKDLYCEVKTPTEEDYVAYYCRVIAAVIRNYPTITSTTRLEIEGARVMALDLDEVAKTGSSAADKQTAMMYLLARHILGQHFFLNHDDIALMPELYRPHHVARVKEIMEEPKRIVLDEFHRTSKSPSVREQVIQDMREGRKWKIHIALASQSLRDFDEIMIEFATSVFILDSGPQVTIEKTSQTFGLTQTEREALRTRVHGPTSRGATFIAQFITKRGLNTQLLTSTISPVELWALTTTTEDVSIRSLLYDLVGAVKARQLLAQRFPLGTASDEINERIKLNSKLTTAQLCNEIVEDLVMQHRKNQRAEKLRL